MTSGENLARAASHTSIAAATPLSPKASIALFACGVLLDKKQAAGMRRAETNSLRVVGDASRFCGRLGLAHGLVGQSCNIVHRFTPS